MSRPPSQPSRTSSVLVGMAAAAMTLGITASLLVVDLNNEIRGANDRLDIAGQSLVEAIRGDLNAVQNLLIRSDSTHYEDPLGPRVRLTPASSLPFVIAVGHATGDEEPVVWFSERTMAIAPIRTALGDKATTKSDHEVLFDTMGEHLILAHPYVVAGERVWDLVLIDMGTLVEAAAPTALGEGVIWDFGALPAGSPLISPERDVHREYLILDSTTTWKFELEWTESALAAQGVGVDRMGIAVGVIAAIYVGVLASKWTRRRYLEADLRATRSLLDQKDLLLKTLSHQLRTPLTGVIGFLRLALDDPADVMSQEQRVELSQLALEQAERAAEIVDDLMIAARIMDSGIVTISGEVEIEPLLSAVFESIRRGTETLLLSGSETTTTSVIADPLRTRQLLRNVFTCGQESGAGTWEVSVHREGEGAFVTISISPDVTIGAASTPLTADNVALPEGLSAVQPKLEIARRLGELMGGQVEIATVMGSSEILVRLPAAVERPTEPSARAGDNTAQARSETGLTS